MILLGFSLKKWKCKNIGTGLALCARLRATCHVQVWSCYNTILLHVLRFLFLPDAFCSLRKLNLAWNGTSEKSYSNFWGFVRKKIPPPKVSITLAENEPSVTFVGFSRSYGNNPILSKNSVQWESINNLSIECFNFITSEHIRMLDKLFFKLIINVQRRDFPMNLYTQYHRAYFYSRMEWNSGKPYFAIFTGRFYFCKKIRN